MSNLNTQITIQCEFEDFAKIMKVLKPLFSDPNVWANRIPKTTISSTIAMEYMEQTEPFVMPMTVEPMTCANSTILGEQAGTNPKLNHGSYPIVIKTSKNEETVILDHGPNAECRCEVETTSKNTLGSDIITSHLFQTLNDALDFWNDQIEPQVKLQAKPQAKPSASDQWEIDF